MACSSRSIQIILCIVCVLFLSIISQIALALPNYDIRIAGYSFDPKKLDKVGPSTLRLSEEERIAYRTTTNYYLVQLIEPINRESRQHLQVTYGLYLREYVPQLAYIEHLKPDIVKRLGTDNLVRAIVPFEPAFKISPMIGKTRFRTQERKAVKGLLLRAVLFADAEPSKVVDRLKSHDVSNILVMDDRMIGGTARIQFTLNEADQLPDIARFPKVRWIEEVTEIIDDNTGAAGTLQSGAAGTPSVWNRGLHGENQIIGIIDSAPPDINHCFFRDPVNNTPSLAHRKILDIRNASGSAAGGHGTFTSGNAAGDDFNNPGAHARRGGAWAIRLVAGNNRDLSSTTLLAELTAAAVFGAVIHTNSWHDNTAGAGNPANYNQNAADVDMFIWNNEDHMVLGSMGNNGEEQGPPGTAKNAIGVNATRADPNEMNLGDGNPGPTADGRRKPDVAAPGCNIQSATVNTTCTTGPRANCATSYATPHTAAALVLIRQYFREGFYPGGIINPANARTPSGALLKAALVNSAIDMTGIPGYPSNGEGWGVLRLEDVLYFPGDARELRVWDFRNANGLTTGETRTHLIAIEGNTVPLKITLVWTEPPGTAGALNPIVNNLDLAVTSPDGTQTFLGNVFNGGVSNMGGTADNVNNVEQVLVNSPAIGTWEVNVTGTAVNVGNPDQGYALVVTAGMAEPQVQIPGNVIFGDVCVGATDMATLDVCNTGKADLVVDAIVSSNASFSANAPSGGYPVHINPYFCFPFQVAFSPIATGPQSAILTVIGNDPDSASVSVNVSGNGTETDIRVNGSTDFGVVSAWSPGEKVVSVCNTGDCELSINSAVIDCTEFTLVNNPFPATIVAGTCMDLTIRFTPSVPGPKTCELTVMSNDPDTPAVVRTLTARTPPYFSLHAGVVDPSGTLGNTTDEGPTLNLDFMNPIDPNWAWDVRLGFSRFDGQTGQDDIDFWTLGANIKYTFNPTSPVRFFLNGGAGLYYFDPGDLEGGVNGGAGLGIPISSRFALEATYNYHTTFTGSPTLRLNQYQLGLLISF